jgi:anti-sigma regulatory factor (Ser/Thr protein kinase)
MRMAGNKKRAQAPDAQLRLSVPPNPKFGIYIRKEVVAFAHRHGIDDNDVSDFVSAIGEAVANAIEHARTERPIEVSAWLLGDDCLYASVRDRGVGFTPDKRMLAKNLADASAERGRGLAIMRRLSDVLSVRSSPGHGTRVTLSCHVHRSASEPIHHIAG